MTPFAKSPRQMRREAERGARRARPAPPPGRCDPARYPSLASETGEELDSAIDWLAHLAAGRVEVR